MSKLGLLAVWAFLTIPGAAVAQTYWGEQAPPRPNAAPQVPSGPQPFAADPDLGRPDRTPNPRPSPEGQDRRPPAASFDMIDMGSGQMRVCQRNGTVVVCQ
jgi:hypothetical protein